MDDLINEIIAAVDNGAWMLALAGTLALPDICAATQSQNGRTTGSKYKAWVTEYLSEQYAMVDPEELYQLRCSLLHQGTTSTVKYKRVVFLAPTSESRMHNCVADDVLVLDLPTFCGDVIAAALEWRRRVSDTAAYKRNSRLLMRWHPQGLGEAVGGFAVLA